MSEARPPLSLGNVLTIVLPVAIIAGAAYWWSTGLESKAREEMSSNVFARMLSANATMSSASMAYPDADNDLVADSPDDPEKCISPDVLMFSFVAGEVESVPAQAWEKLFAQLAEKAGREVKYIHYGTTGEQLAALKNGDVHIVGLNTGACRSARSAARTAPMDTQCKCSYRPIAPSKTLKELRAGK
jgi:phosphonate transport system substrate-binding protein